MSAFVLLLSPLRGKSFRGFSRSRQVCRKPSYTSLLFQYFEPNLYTCSVPSIRPRDYECILPSSNYWVGIMPPAVAGDTAHNFFVLWRYSHCCSYHLARLGPRVTPPPVFFWTCILYAEGYRTLGVLRICLLYTSPSPRDGLLSRMPSSA